MEIGILTTSRADFGIYLPLIKAIEKKDGLSYSIFVGGSHLSEKFGLTYKDIEADGISITEKIESVSNDDTPFGVSKSIGSTISSFSELWKQYYEELDILFVLGDRFEMFAAAVATVPFNIKLAHLHGGEKTLGSIDNKFRNALTAISSYHFTSTEGHADRVREIIGSDENVHDVGSLGVEAISNTELMPESEFRDEFDFDISQSYILSTYHPETVNLGENANNIQQLLATFEKISEPILCSLPNADTEGKIIREALLKYQETNPEKISCTENLGQVGYYTAMKHCKMLIGNSSSGIIEAASFQIPVVNVGERQKGREASNNVIHVANDSEAIMQAYTEAANMDRSNIKNIYSVGPSSSKIIEILADR